MDGADQNVQLTQVPVADARNGVQPRITLGVVGSKTQPVDITEGETITDVCSRENISVEGRSPLVNGDYVDWDYVPRPDDYVMLMQHVSGA